MEKTVCYLCKGCGLGEALDFKELTEAVNEARTGAIDEVKEHDVLCSPEGVAMIQADIESEGLDGVVIGACSFRFKTDEFNFGPEVMVARAALREQALWVTEPSYEDEEEEGEDRLMLAQDVLRISCAQLGKSSALEPFQLEEGATDAVMVVGAGPAGMSAALAAAGAGRQVFLVEKENEIGGFLSKMAKLGPQTPPYNQLEDTGLEELKAKIESDGLIHVFTGVTVAKTLGMPGNFNVELSNGETFTTGAIVQATGWAPYPKENLAEDLNSGLSGVISNVEMEQKAKADELGGLNAVAFIQCAGSRDENHLPYCSAVCCLVSCKQAMYVKEANPEAAVYVIYKDVRTPDQSEEVYREAQRRGVIFVRRPEDVYPQISESRGKLAIETRDVLLDDDISIEDLDLVVLATGMQANNPKVVDPPLIPFDMPDEKGKELTKKALAECDDWSVLNLEYRQGPNLPTLRYSMPDSHFICFPYETRRTGIYAAGAVRRPMALLQAQDDALGATLKAIQSIGASDGGFAVHPRSGDMSFPDFAMQRCTQCKRCTEECPFGAINEDADANPLPNITRCRRCGTCMGACPERIISFKNYSIDQIGSQIKTIEVPDEDDEKPRIVALTCENDALPALDMVAAAGRKLSPWVRFIPVRCLGSVNLVWVADSLAAGIDGIMLLGCSRGDNYQCHFVRGSELANVRMSKIAETLQRLVLEPERVGVFEVAINDVDGLVRTVNGFAEEIEGIDPNPYKGF